MTDTLLRTTVPKNLRLREDVRVKILNGQGAVDSDMFKICDRIKNIHPSLYIIQLEDDDARSWSIMEHTARGTEELVCKVDELDSRVLTKIRRMRRIPLEKRFAALEAEIEREKERELDDALEDVYDKMGADFHKQLAHDGFIGHTGKSFAKRGVKITGDVGRFRKNA